MSKQKEDVLLMVKHVKYKKVDGTLYVNSGRVAWRNQTSDSFRISAPFEDIRLQRVSPDQKEKVQLQLLMHNNESFTFQFSDPIGREKQLEMRNRVKEMLQHLLPKFKDKAHSELNEKFRLLESNPQLLALYKELVVTGILSSEEFWARPEFPQKSGSSPSVSNAKASEKQSLTDATGKSQALTSYRLQERAQTPGVPSFLLSDIKPEVDGVNSIKYNLTQETIDAIFRAYPTVRQRHRELVPDKLSQTAFWEKFFQSHYFHRDRIQIKQDDVFGECAAQDERILQSELRKSRRMRLSTHLNIGELEDKNAFQGYGTDLKDTDITPVAAAPATPSVSEQKLSANQLLLRRFNMHSIMILRSLCSIDPPSQHPANHLDSTRNEASYKELASSGHLKERIFRTELLDETPDATISLQLEQTKDYFEGPTVAQSKSVSGLQLNGGPGSASFKSGLNPSQAKQALLACLASIRMARRGPPSVCSDYNAQLAIADVSAGGFLMGGKATVREQMDWKVDSRTSAGTSSNGTPGSSVNDAVSAAPQHSHSVVLLSPDQSKELALLYVSAGELLRHFWACFPVTSPQLGEKLDRISESLNRFKSTKLYPFITSLESPGVIVEPSTSSPATKGACSTNRYRSRVTAHLESMINCAESKYKEWNERRRK
uniref:General transcription factor IIH subunit 1 n=1 Tax=Schistocephalus solidus TaxID=70667 RepID=A0A0X3PDI6_SCHSO